VPLHAHFLDPLHMAAFMSAYLPLSNGCLQACLPYRGCKGKWLMVLHRGVVMKGRFALQQTVLLEAVRVWHLGGM
jgi:hypothetical protein